MHHGARLLVGAVAATLVAVLLSAGLSQTPAVEPIRAIRFDPGYYYNTGVPVDVLARRLVTHWQSQGVNLVYFYAYSFAYGARYPTRYRHNSEEDFGRLNLLGRVVEEAQRRNMRVVAWVYLLRHRGAWEAHPEWRSLTRSGQPYAAGFDRYFLSPHSPEAVQWWVGFVEDLIMAVPGIDGIDLAEPIVNWWGRTADYSPAARVAFAAQHPRARLGEDAWLRFRTGALTKVIRATAEVAQRHGKELHITTTLTARADGSLLGLAEQAVETGFDLEQVLQGEVRPDVVNVELIYQQWSRLHRAARIFTPEWTAQAAAAAAAQIRGRARLVAHVELSPFDGLRPNIREFERALTALGREGFVATDIYDTHLVDAAGGWDVVRRVYTGRETPGFSDSPVLEEGIRLPGQ